MEINKINPPVSQNLNNNFNNVNQSLLTPNIYFPNNFNANFSMSLKKDAKLMNPVNLYPLYYFNQKEQTEILKSFKSGLKQYDVSEVYLTAIINSLNLGTFNVNESNILKPDNINEIMAIQEKINNIIDTPDANKFGLAKKLKVNGHFDKNMISYLLFLNDTQQHGSPVKLDIDSIRQVGSTACYLTSEAMYFNFMHQKNGKSDAYTEFDTRERIKSSDRTLETELSPGIISEDSNGRISIKRDKGLKLVNFIDNELNRNKPVITGVSSRKQAKGEEYNEGITDHFVLITGRGYDENGVYYTFNDPFSGGKDNKFRLDPLSGKLYGFGDSSRKYDVTDAASYNTPQDKNEYYKMIGKPLPKSKMTTKNILQYQNNLKQLGYNVTANGKYNKNLTEIVKNFQNRNNLPETGIIDSYTLEKLELSMKEKN